MRNLIFDAVFKQKLLFPLIVKVVGKPSDSTYVWYSKGGDILLVCRLENIHLQDLIIR